MRFLLTFLFLAVLLPGSYSFATEYTIEIGWTIEETEGIELAGFRLYDLQQIMVCETTAPAETMVCTVDILGTEATFTLVSYSTDGVESDHSDPFVIVFEEPDPLVADFSYTTTEGSLSVNFDASSSTGQISEYKWEFGDGGVEYGLTSNHTFATAATYPVLLTIKDDQGTTVQTTQDVTLSQSSGDNQSPTPVLSADPGNGNSPLNVTFDASGSSDPDDDALTYSWDFGDGTTAGNAGSEIVHTYVVSTAGTITYTATVTVSDSQSSSTVNLPIQVTNDGSGTGTATAVITAGATGSAPVTVNLRATNSSPSEGATITTYTWNFGDGSTGEGDVVSHLFTDDGSYGITLTIIDSAGVEDTATKIIDVDAPGIQNNVPTLIQVYKLLLLNN